MWNNGFIFLFFSSKTSAPTRGRREPPEQGRRGRRGGGAGGGDVSARKSHVFPWNNFFLKKNKKEVFSLVSAVNFWYDYSKKTLIWHISLKKGISLCTLLKKVFPFHTSLRRKYFTFHTPLNGTMALVVPEMRYFTPARRTTLSVSWPDGGAADKNVKEITCRKRAGWRIWNRRPQQKKNMTFAELRKAGLPRAARAESTRKGGLLHP